MLVIWGRANSVNVKKVLWCCDELGLLFERIDAGLTFGRVNDADFLAMNPNGRVPTLVDGGYVVWESHAILRYLASEYGSASTLYPGAPKARSDIDRWLDWTLSTLVPAARMLSPATRRASAVPIDPQAGIEAMAPVVSILNQQLSRPGFVAGAFFTIADIAVAVFVWRWFAETAAQKPELIHLDRWWLDISARPGFKRYVA